MSRITHTNKSYHTHEWVVRHLKMSQIPHVNELHHIYLLHERGTTTLYHDKNTMREKEFTHGISNTPARSPSRNITLHHDTNTTWEKEFTHEISNVPARSPSRVTVNKTPNLSHLRILHHQICWIRELRKGLTHVAHEADLQIQDWIGNFFEHPYPFRSSKTFSTLDFTRNRELHRHEISKPTSL